MSQQQLRIARSWAPRIVALGALFVLTSGFSGQGRFSQPLEAGASSAVLNQVRAVVRPLYAVRGALFQLRLELTASDPANAADREVFEPWLSLDAADAGWAAQQLDQLRTAPSGQRPAVAQRIATTLGGLRDRRQIQDDAALFTDSAVLPTLETGRPFAPPGPALIAVLAAPASKARVVARVQTIQGAITSFQTLPAEVQRVVAAARVSGRQASQDGQKAARGNLNGILDTTTNVVGAVAFGQEVLADVEAIPAVLTAIVSESSQLATTLGGIAADTASGLGDLALAPLQSLTASGLPTAAAYDALKDLCNAH